MVERFMLLPFDMKYAISNKGKLINVKTGKKLKTRINHSGYEEVMLSTNGRRKNYRIHRLVALTFINNKYNKPYVNHIDGNKLNNNVENLEWCTAKENINHAINMKLIQQQKPIQAIDLETNFSLCFESLSECARYFGTNKGTIHRVLSGKRHKYKNFKFIYM